MRTLTFATLYPNQSQPRHGIFVEQRLRHLLASGAVESRVVAPVPWFPSGRRCFGRYGVYARAPRREVRHGIEIIHPRYPVIPKMSMSAAPFLLAAAARGAVRELVAGGFELDLIDAHYLYPDGVAALLLGRWLGKPVVLSALGDDVITLPLYPLPRRLILWAVAGSAGVLPVCQALADVLLRLGAPAEKVRVVRFGVDRELFRPVDREAVRRRLGLAGRVLLVVGHVEPRKGQHLAIGALPALPGTTLLVAGDGVYEAHLRRLAAELGVLDRVRFLGHVEQEELKDLYGAADALVLASSREGIANVLLESMACGTPVVATPVWGTPEAVSVPAAGVLMAERTVPALVAAVEALFAAPPDREATRRHALTFSWESTCSEILEVMHRALARPATAVSRPRLAELPSSSAIAGTSWRSGP
jgi:teichuronic acid biosynthesis glycosyltransferase TuaC